jgi:hypothetical protein
LKHGTHALAFEFGGILIRNNAAYDDYNVSHLFLLQKLHHAGHDSIVRSGKNGQAYNLHIFLERGVDDHLRRLAESGIDYLHAGIAQRPGDYLGAAIMSVEAGLGHQHPDSRIHTLRELTGTRRKATQGQGGAFALNRAPRKRHHAQSLFSIERITATQEALCCLAHIATLCTNVIDQNEWHNDCSFDWHEAIMRWTPNVVILSGLIIATSACDRPASIDDRREREEKTDQAAHQAGEDAYKAAAKAKQLAREAEEKMEKAGHEVQDGWEDAKHHDPNPDAHHEK